MLNQQSLHVSAPSTSTQFLHHLSLLSSRSDSQRRDSLSYLTSVLNCRTDNTSLPRPTSIVLPKIYPLILDGTNSVRQQSLRLLQCLPGDEISDRVPEILPYIRAGMTHLAADIRLSCIDVLAWLMEIAPNGVVSCAGGWVKTLNCFLALFGWHGHEATQLPASNRVSFGTVAGDGKIQARNLQVLAQFLNAGFRALPQLDEESERVELRFPLSHTQHHLLPQRSNPYGYLCLFGQQQDDDADMLEDWQDRIRVFHDRFAPSVAAGLASAKTRGGEVGRAAGLVAKSLQSISQ